MSKNKLLEKLNGGANSNVISGGIFGARVAMLSQRLAAHGISAKHKIVGAVAAMSCFAVVTAVATVQDRAPVPSELVIDRIQVQPTSLGDAAVTTYWHEVRFDRGDTFAAMLARLRIDSIDISRITKDPAAMALLPQLRPSTSVQAEVSSDGRLQSLRFVGGNDQLIGIDRTDSGFKQVDKQIKLTRRIAARAATVRNSFFGAADGASVPDGVATQLSEVFGTQIDFQRDLRRGDRFSVVYEEFYHQGRMIRTGRLLAAEVVVSKRVSRAVWFETADAHGYYNGGGESLQSAFLRSPLEFSRITSGFEMRYDPRSGRWHAHKGIDYAAPTGTPVRATGDGIVHFIGPQSGYGNLLVLKHRGEYTTLYAHLHNFGEGLREGSKVAQGDVIGFVGQTGWATGPHLHYEFQIRGEHVDPLNAALPTSTPLDTRQTASFRVQAAPLLSRLDLLRNATLASAE